MTAPGAIVKFVERVSESGKGRDYCVEEVLVLKMVGDLNQIRKEEWENDELEDLDIEMRWREAWSYVGH